MDNRTIDNTYCNNLPEATIKPIADSLLRMGTVRYLWYNWLNFWVKCNEQPSFYKINQYIRTIYKLLLSTDFYN